MTVVDRNKIDIAYVEDNKHILEIVDHLEWDFATRQDHGHILQDKINDYLDYIVSGQAEEAKPGLRPVIRIISKYPYSKYCIDFLERAKKFIKEKDNYSLSFLNTLQKKSWKTLFRKSRTILMKTLSFLF